MKNSPALNFQKFISIAVVALSFPAASFGNSQTVSVKLETFSQSRTGQNQLQATFWKSQSEPKNKSVLLVHMLGKNKDEWKDFGTKLSTLGYDVLAIDLREQGAAGQLSLVEDIQSSVIYLRNRPDTQNQRVVLVGANIGANGIVNYAASTKQMHLLVDSAILLSPGENYRGVGLLEAIQKISAIPSLLVAAEDDEYSAKSVKKALNSCNGSTLCKEHLFSSGGHGTQLLRSKYSKELEALITNFIEEHK